MADDAFRQLFCLLQGEHTVFQVKARLSDRVADLKKTIFQECKNTLHGIT
jgi:hypothetical protein